MQKLDKIQQLKEQLDLCNKQISLIGQTIAQASEESTNNEETYSNEENSPPEDLDYQLDTQSQLDEQEYEEQYYQEGYEDMEDQYQQSYEETPIPQDNSPMQQQEQTQNYVLTSPIQNPQVIQIKTQTNNSEGKIFISQYISGPQAEHTQEHVVVQTKKAIKNAQSQSQPKTLVFDRDLTYDDSILIQGSINIETLPSVVVKFKKGGFKFQSELNYNYQTFTEVRNQYRNGKIPGTIITGLVGSNIVFANSQHGLKRGDVIRLCSENVYNWIRASNKARIGECAVVVQNDGNIVWLDRKLNDPAKYSKFYKYSDAKLNIQLNIENTDDLDIGGSLVTVNNYQNAQISVQCYNSTYQCLTIGGNYMANVDAIIQNIRNYTVDKKDKNKKSKWGYGIVDQNNEGCYYRIECKNIRHGYTTTFGGSSSTPNVYGQAKDNIITGRGIDCITPFDTHASGENIRFENCQSLYSYGSGFTNRSNNTVFFNCVSIGSSDSGFQNYDECSYQEVQTNSNNKKCTLINCQVRGHKRGIKSDYQHPNKQAPENRFNVELIDCTFECDTYRQLIFIRNTDLTYKNLTLRQLSKGGSINPDTYTSYKKFVIKSFITVINSSVYGNAKFIAQNYAKSFYPFCVQVAKTDHNTNPQVRIHQTQLDLDDSKWNSGLCFGQIFVSKALNDQILPLPTTDPKWVEGLNNFYFQVDQVILHNKNYTQNTENKNNPLVNQEVYNFMINKATTFNKCNINKLWKY